VPDALTQDRLIEDKLKEGGWSDHETHGDTWFVSASAWALGMSARVIKPGETPEGVMRGLVKRMGMPTVRSATRQAMRFLGHHFVLGETIERCARTVPPRTRPAGYRHSYDMLGEGARTLADAKRYFKSYADAIAAIGKSADKVAAGRKLPDRPGISVKLSALHPRYLATQRAIRWRPNWCRTLVGWRRWPRRMISTSHRRRGGRPAGTLARRDRPRLCRSVAGRLGRLRSRDPGLSEARTAGDRPYLRPVPKARPADDGAAGQGRLLGHRDQAGAGTRA
jgi:hypothetical protein